MRHGQAARLDLEGRDADRARSGRRSGRQRRATRRASTPAPRSRPSARRRRACPEHADRDVKMLGHGELTKKLAVTGARLLEERGREDRGGRRQRHLAEAAARAEEAPAQEAKPQRDRRAGRGRAERDEPEADAEPDRRREPKPTRAGARDGARLDALLARQRVARARAAQARALHGLDPGALPARALDPGPRRRLRARSRATSATRAARCSAS